MWLVRGLGGCFQMDLKNKNKKDKNGIKKV